jgi:hypothetical protein
MNKKNLLAIFVAVLTVLGLLSVGVSAEGTEEDLLVYYSFDDANDLGKDSSGKGHNAQVDGALTGSEGLTGGAAKFDGAADLMVTESGIAGLKLFTISVWVKPAEDAFGGLVSLVSGHNWSDYGAMHICFRDTGELAVDVDYMWNAWLSSNATFDRVQTDEWTLITIVFDAEEGWVWTYFNGTMVNEVGFVGGEKGVDFSNFTIGGWSNNGTVERFFKGEMDEFKIYNKALSADEVKALAGDYYEEPVTESTEAPDTNDTETQPDDSKADSTAPEATDSSTAADTNVPTTNQGNTEEPKDGLSVGAIIGIVAAVIVVVAVVVVVLKKKK